MTLPGIAVRYVFGRPFVTALTVLAIALGVALVSAVLTLRRETERAFAKDAALFDLVVGAKGSPTQLVLSSVYHMDTPTGNVPNERYEELQRDRAVTSALPVGLGDNFQGFRIVGTEQVIFDISADPRSPADADAPALLALASGERFEAAFEAVLGAQVAERTGLGVGDTFSGTHGLIHAPGAEAHGDHPFTIVGILQPSGTAWDRVILTPLDSVWAVHDAEKELHRNLANLPGTGAEGRGQQTDSPSFLMGYEAAPQKTGREVTAILLRLQTPGLRLSKAAQINAETDAMAAIPIMEMQRLYTTLLDNLQRALLAVAYLVVIVAALSILTTLYQSALQRRRELAILRTLGAHRLEILLIVVLEGLALSLLGVALGWLLGHGAIALAEMLLQERLGITANAWSTDRAEWLALAVIAATGLVAGLVPALLAYRRPPVRDLAGT